MRFDLHVHTDYSDGLYSPEKLIDLAIINDLDGVAITDHDTIDGIESALTYCKKFNNFKVIPGIEFGCIYNDEEVHILGYFIDFKNKDLVDITLELKRSRINRGAKMVEKINDLGYGLTLEDVIEYSGNEYIGRPHIGRAMVKKGYVESVAEAFNKYLARGKAAYVERYKITIEDTISLIKNCGGIPVLAHPGLLIDKNIIKHCINSGIDGIECIHSKHSKEQTKEFNEIANSFGLIKTGGSDFHGDKEVNNPTLGQYWVDISKIPKFWERI